MYDPNLSSAAPAADPARDRAERHLRTLQELAEIGMGLAREVARQASDQTAETPSAPDFALAFSRIARAVRQTVALEARLAEGRQTGETGRAALAVSDRWRSARRRRQVKELVGEIIEAEATEFDAERLYDDLDDRMEEGDEDADFADRPIGELVARICRDLGVTPDWSLFEDDDWAIAERRERNEGSPYAAAGAADDRQDDAPSDPPWPAHDPPGKASH